MAVANSNSNNESSIRKFNCYKLASLTKTILDANQTSNLKDRYVLGEELGWGQFGVIRVCSDRLTGEELACKSINKDRLVTQDDVRSVKLEIEIMTRLSGHPNVVDLKAVYEEENYVHLVMELCEGGELFHQLEKHGRFSEGEARVIFRHLMEVVLYCHDKGVVHRDLKPENILLATKSSSSPIKLADFGLATYINPGEDNGMAEGTNKNILSSGYTFGEIREARSSIFKGIKGPDDAENWLRSMIQTFEAMGVIGDNRVSLATFLLKEKVEHW